MFTIKHSICRFFCWNFLLKVYPTLIPNKIILIDFVNEKKENIDISNYVLEKENYILLNVSYNTQILISNILSRKFFLSWKGTQPSFFWKGNDASNFALQLYFDEEERVATINYLRNCSAASKEPFVEVEFRSTKKKNKHNDLWVHNIRSAGRVPNWFMDFLWVIFLVLCSFSFPLCLFAFIFLFYLGLGLVFVPCFLSSLSFEKVLVRSTFSFCPCFLLCFYI